MKRMYSLLILSACLAAPLWVAADVKLNSLFTDNMVLQQKIAVPVWGTAEEGEDISITFNGQTVSAKSQDGKWMARLSPMNAGGPFEMTVKGKNTITIKNVLIGEVWVCSGQSNMQFPVQASTLANEVIPKATNPNIRLFSVPRIVASAPQSTVDAKWEECTPKTVPDFSAVAYFFGAYLQKELNVPVGLIHTSWGGTPAESWTTLETLKSNPLYSEILKRYDDGLSAAEKKYQEFPGKFQKWVEDAKKLNQEGKMVPGMPALPTEAWWSDQYNNPNRPAGLYNAMIAPLIPYAIQGAIWYQGESNAGRAYQYRSLFADMIKDWRKCWGQGDFSFFFVQLANFNSNPHSQDWPELREAQTMTLSLPKTGMAVTTDIGDATDIHPKNKIEVGRRLSLAALKVAYDEDVVYSGPMYKSLQVQDGKAYISFTNLGSGLITKNCDPLKGFEIAGEDKEYVPAEAEIIGTKVVVSSSKVSKPVAVRYAWRNNPEDANLFNKEGLPASSFRTDEWPGITANNK